MIKKLLTKIANELDVMGMPEQATEIDNIISDLDIEEAVEKNAFNDTDLLLKHFGERGLMKAWREENIYKTSSMAAIERKKLAYLQDFKSKK